jgi:hypothetical protein
MFWHSSLSHRLALLAKLLCTEEAVLRRPVRVRGQLSRPLTPSTRLFCLHGASGLNAGVLTMPGHFDCHDQPRERALTASGTGTGSEGLSRAGARTAGGCSLWPVAQQSFVCP